MSKNNIFNNPDNESEHKTDDHNRHKNIGPEDLPDKYAEDAGAKSADQDDQSDVYELELDEWEVAENDSEDNFYDDFDEDLVDDFNEDPDDDEYWYKDGEYDEDIEDDDEEHDEGGPSGLWSKTILRVVALITVLFFMGLVALEILPITQLPLADLIRKSNEITQNDINVERLQQAVVRINVVARGDSPAAPAKQTHGTGFNIDPGGIIITNHHVVEDALNMTVTFPDGSTFKAGNWHSVPGIDIAIVRLLAENLPVVPVSGKGRPASGEIIRVVGNPLGLNNIVVDGTVGNYVQLKDTSEPVFTINAPIYPGNSGSPVFNDDGEVVGVVFGRMIVDSENGKKSYGLAVPLPIPGI